MGERPLLAWATVREGLRRKKDKIKSVSYKLMHSATLTSFIIIFGESVFFCRNPKKIYTIQISCYSEKDSVDFHSSSMTSLAYIDCIAAARSSYCTVAFVAIGIVLSLPGPPPPPSLSVRISDHHVELSLPLDILSSNGDLS